MIKLGSNSIGKIYLGSNSIGKANLGSNLVFQKGSSPIPPEPLPYTPVEYIVTDGSCYISTGKPATPPKSSEIKVRMGSSTSCGLLGGFNQSSGSDSKGFALAKFAGSTKVACITYYSNYASSDGMPSVQWSIDNNRPFIIKTDMKKGAQNISVKQENSENWTTATKSNNNTVSSTYGLNIFALYNNGYFSLAPSGTRLYYCKIYGDETYTNLIFDGVPCLYNGEYGLWDKVSDTFKGNANSTGAFSGPSDS